MPTITADELYNFILANTYSKDSLTRRAKRNRMRSFALGST